MKEKVYVFGHQNPDTDSICSALSYSYLKQQLDPERDYQAVALKTVNQETAFILDYFDIEAPPVVTSLKPQVSDINLADFASVRETDSIRKTLEVIINQTGRIVPVVDDYERLIGVVSISDLVPRMLSLLDKTILKKTRTPFDNMITNLNLAEITDPKMETLGEFIEGNVYLSTDIQGPDKINELEQEDIIICNQREIDTYMGKVACIIVGDIQDKTTKDALKINYQDAVTKIYCSEKTNFEIVKALAQTTPISTTVAKTGLEYFVTYETLDDVKDNMMSSRFRRFPVVTEKGRVMGMISRSDLVDINKKKAILVDHNERGQSIEGIEDIEILEIIDHHRVADVMTIAPLYFRVEPVGCTSTIVAKMFEENNVEIPPEIAGLMLSAIISDTLLFNSPTCTPTDKETAVKLAEIADIDINLYGMKMIRAGSNIQDESPEDILTYDRKKFMFGQYKVSISQINTGDYDGFYKIFDETVAEMEKLAEKEDFDLLVLLVTDVVVGGTELIAVGDAKWMAENAFELKNGEKSIFLPGVFSRKKQIVPKLMNAAML